MGNSWLVDDSGVTTQVRGGTGYVQADPIGWLAQVDLTAGFSGR